VTFARCKRKSLPAGGRECPARPRGQPFIPLCLEGSRRRIRLLSVHSHSHGGAVAEAVKRVACKSPCAFSAQVCRTAGFFCRVFRLHGAVFLPFSGFSSPDSMFLSSYQNYFVFSSENPQKAHRLLCSSRKAESDVFIKEAIAREPIGSACTPFLIDMTGVSMALAPYYPPCVFLFGVTFLLPPTNIFYRAFLWSLQLRCNLSVPER
jgi:hypothetical protein